MRVTCVDVSLRSLIRAESRWAGRNAIVSGSLGTGPVHFGTVNVARWNAAAPCSRTSCSMSAPVPPGYGWNVHDIASPLPSGGGGGAWGAWTGVAWARARAPNPNVLAA